MAITKRIKRGLDIPLSGAASMQVAKCAGSALYAICPDDYPGAVWKSVVKPGDAVASGDALFRDKETGLLCLCAPVSGTVKEVHRGERRHIEYISIEKSGDAVHEFDIDRDGITKALQASGLWAMMRQRPYDIVPEPGVEPRDIFVTAFDSAPLAGPMLYGELSQWLGKGLEVLSQYTHGKLYVGTRPGQGIQSVHAEVVEFEGPHPAGNASTQIAAIAPVNKGETVWTLDAATVARIGRLVATGRADYGTVVAVTGPCVAEPHMVETWFGAQIASLVGGNIKCDGKCRIISGNVLTGTKTVEEGYMHWPYRQVTVIDEGDDADEFMGWASMSPSKYSVKRSFPAFLRGLSKPFGFDARIKGGRRAMILSGEYDEVFPFDIYPEYLIKAIMANDIERMEKLGIYEVAPEDFALPEFVDTSKIELQKIVRQGLDNLRKELS